MKLFFKGLLLTAILTSVIGLPFFAFAQDYTLLEKSVLPGNQETTNFTTYIEQGFKTFLAVVVIIAIVMLTASGLQYITAGSGGGKGEAKNRAMAALLGLLIALSAYLILRTINPDLVNLTLDINDRGGDVGRDISPPTNPPNTGGGGGGGSGGGGGGTPQQYGGPEGVYGPIPENEFEVRERIKEATNGKVTFNDDANCKPGNEQSCRTYLGGLNEDQINGIINLSNECDCNLTINGAAEPGGHIDNSSHYSGDAVDLDKQFATDTFIVSNGTNVGEQGNGVRYLINGGYCEDENSAHWHCRF